MTGVAEILAFFGRRRTDYQIFRTEAGKRVYADIEDFCCGSKTTAADNDPHAMAIREGRRQVLLRINRAINMTPDEQWVASQQRDKV